jgi:1,3-beta-galactosyl-N-acetylhexosamine phosphorylase
MDTNPLRHGGFTLPSQEGMDKETLMLASKWGADAIRDSDGTQLSDDLLDLGLDVYSTLCLIRLDQDWARKHPEALQQMVLCTERITCKGEGPLSVYLLEQYFDQQFQVNWKSDPAKYWEVIDRTSGEVVSADQWKTDADAGTVVLSNPLPFHEYTVSFLAYQVWETTSMYNHLTNDWGDRPHQMPVDPRHPQTRAHLETLLQEWIDRHPRTAVVRFTSMAYQFSVMRGASSKRLYRDWAGYHGTVSPLAFDVFEATYGYRIRPETFVQAGYRSHTDAVPDKAYLDWIRFTEDFLMDLVKSWVDRVHANGKKAYFFYCDHYIGMEPYRERFHELGLDGVISPVIDGPEYRKNADCTENMVREVRMYPYFFPTEGERPVFAEGGDPVKECRYRWQHVRRALLRNCVDRIGYGGYLDLAMQYPEFLDTVEEVAREFRFIKHHGGQTGPYNHGVKVGVLTAWGRMRSWHSEGAADFGFLECLSGLPFDVQFISFEEVVAGKAAAFDVLINYGPEGTSWSGGQHWLNPEVLVRLRQFVFEGGALVGVHEPTAIHSGGRYFQLADVFGVDKRHVLARNTECLAEPLRGARHPIISGMETAEILEQLGCESGVSVTGEGVTLLAGTKENVGLAVHEYGKGRSVFMAREAYSVQLCALLKRVLFWAGKVELHNQVVAWDATSPAVETAYFPSKQTCIVINNTVESVDFTLHDAMGTGHKLSLGPLGIKGFSVEAGNLGSEL